MMNKKLEVLAPAGSMESLTAAVFAGADAVYLGGTQFSARANAQNFDSGALKEAADFCRVRGVRLYVTVNTLLKDSELPESMRFIEYLCALPVDAVIIQDPGLLQLLRRCAPELEVHASTQMSVHTPAAARLLSEQGFRRVVLARELSEKEIKGIRQGSEIELEAFVHGALCMSLSGGCYLSALLGGRSGNRGMCAQPCRLPFHAPGGTGHDLSLKDLSLVQDVERMADAGVTSFKIEGRMKRPEYVAAAVAAVRAAVDQEPVPDSLLQNLEAVFSRSGFTSGYFHGRTGRALFGIRTEQDVKNTNKKVLSSLKELYRIERKRVPVRFSLSGGDTVALAVTDEDGNTATAFEVVSIQETALSAERCAEQLNKTGGTPFYAEEVSVPESGVQSSVRQLNALRRDVLTELASKRAQKPPIPFMEPILLSDPPYPGRAVLNPSKWASFQETGQLGDFTRHYDRIILPVTQEEAAVLQALQQYGIASEKLVLDLPRAMLGAGAEERIRGKIRRFRDLGFRDFLCGNIGAVALCREEQVFAHGSFALNIANEEALSFYSALGLSTAELSFELSRHEVQTLMQKARNRNGNPDETMPGIGLMIYGRQEVMLTRNCPAANKPGACKSCIGTAELTDRKNKRFPVKCTRIAGHSHSTVLNSVPLCLFGEMNHLKEADHVLLRFTVENSVECEGVTDALIRQENPFHDYTKGLFHRGVL